MKNLSEFQTRKEWQEFIWLEFIKKLQETKSAKQLQETVEIILSAKEKDLIIKRLTAAFLISQGKKYREIGDILWISHGTISAVKKNLSKKSIYHGSQYYTAQNAKTKNDLKNKLENSRSKKITIKDMGEATADLINWLNSLPIFIPTHGKNRWQFLDLRYKDNIRYGKNRLIK